MEEECTQPGVYIIFDITGEVFYVGESKEVGGRVSKHITGTK